MSALASHFPPLADYSSWQLAKTREDLDFILRFAGASLLAGDDSIITGFASWMTSVLAARGLPDGIVSLGIEVLQECLPEGRSEVHRLLTAMKTASSAEH
jgi:hypothetical protein